MTSSYTILLLFQVQIHSTIIFISQDFVNFNQKCNIINILWNRKNSGIIDIYGITQVVYNKFEVIRTWYSTLWSPSYDYRCIRYRVKLFTAIQKVEWPYNNMFRNIITDKLI